MWEQIRELVNSDTHYVLGFSGGKDSVASWLHITRDLGLKKVTCLFADTGHEFPELHEYLDLLEREHGCPLVRIHATLEDMDGELKPAKVRARLGLPEDFDLSARRLDMETLAILKRRFPSSTVRFCTTQLKLSPSRRWMAKNCDANVVRVSGVRAQESEARAAKRPVSHDEYMGCLLWMPIHKWTHDQVFDTHKRFGIPVNPLYLQGMGRVGCAPCIMARKEELAAIAHRKPEAFERLGEMEVRVANSVGKPVMSFFSTGKTPDRFCSATCPRTGKPFPVAEDVKRWALSAPPADQPLLFEEDFTEDVYACQSQYGLCE